MEVVDLLRHVSEVEYHVRHQHPAPRLHVGRFEDATEGKDLAQDHRVGDDLGLGWGH